MKKATNILLFFLVLAIVLAILSRVTTFGDIRAPFSFFGPQGGVFISQDGGQNWQRSNARLDQETSLSRVNVTDIVFNPLDSRIVYLGTRGNALFKSLDGGEQWIKVVDKNNALSPRAFINAVVLDYTRPNYSAGLGEQLYVAAFQDDFGRILKSTDGGETFREVYVALNSDQELLTLAIDPGRPSILWAGTSEGVLLASTDFGESWQKVAEFGSALREISINPRNGNELLIVTERGEVFRTFDAALSWQEITGSLKPLIGRNLPRIVRYDPNLEGILYAAGLFGVIRTFDNGLSWQSVNLVIPNDALPVTDVQFSPKHSSIIYVTAGNNIYKTTDGGVSWEVNRLGAKKELGVIAIDPTEPLKILIGINEL